MKNSFHILLVEDDPDDIELLRIAMTDNNVLSEMDILIQGDRVIPWLENAKTPPDLIILDLNLPKMDGRQILKILKSSAAFKNIPVLILTTSSAKQDRDFCLQAGAEKFITKPSSIEGFNELVSSIVELAGQLSRL